MGQDCPNRCRYHYDNDSFKHYQVMTIIASRDDVKKGIDIALDAVSPTLGVEGRTAIIPNPMGIGGYSSTDDGLSVIRAIKLKGAQEVGVAWVRQIAIGMETSVGDGRTTGMVIFKALIDQLHKTPYSVSLRDELRAIGGYVSGKLDEMTVPVMGNDLVKIAANACLDREGGQLIADMLTELGTDTSILVDGMEEVGIRSELVKGLEFKKGYSSPYMINAPKGQSVIEHTPILVTDQSITNRKQLAEILKKMEDAGHQRLVIFCKEIVGEGLGAASMVALKSPFQLLVVGCQEAWETFTELIQDIAVSCGAELMTQAHTIHWDQIDLSMLGEADKVIADKDKTVIIGGKANPEKLNLAIELLRKEIEVKAKKPQLDLRLARLTGGVGTLFVGTKSRAELEVKKHKLEDAISATRQAMLSGVMSGGGAELVKMDLPPTRAGRIVRKALEAPLLTMAHNVGLNSQRVLQSVRGAKKNYGYDFRANKVRDLLEAGIADPLSVIKGAFEVALSTAIMYWTVSDKSVIIDDERKE